MTIMEVKSWWNEGLITLLEARKFSKELGYNMAKKGNSWIWFNIN